MQWQGQCPVVLQCHRLISAHYNQPHFAFRGVHQRGTFVTALHNRGACHFMSIADGAG